ncbi:hypothetical protein M409DRAFT_38350 [Zasmidium cellare ATCC 36951]|uniref:Aspartokinase n=1 Tax=Zasmidium cellare ATCC 36951 TaxID=1080233 RepID=A0A6A6BXP7_ZASCE|nr:uncharacterized protein M409DRAFT_38350 [Zasmidium cellare ATCC 36951]KAF2158309.1 hypothetical protein M409DRAFT_38350 [Zasmidium cellare ATCC 36951]
MVPLGLLGAGTEFSTIGYERATKSATQHATTRIKGQIVNKSRNLGNHQPANAHWIVQKFGGTSLGKFATTIAEDIVLAGLEEHRVAVVCSARSTKTKSEGTTNRLLRAAVDVLVADSRSCAEYVEAIRLDHVTIGQETIKNDSALERYIAHVDRECNRLLRMLESARLLKAVTDQTKDMIVSVGEKLSCLYMTTLLQTKGANAVCMDLSEIGDFSSTITLDTEFYRKIAYLIGAKINTLGHGVVPVITGFFGKIPGGLLAKIGRGYTDLCAALTAVALNARELQIWKEVDGIFTADPRKVPGARLLSTVTPAEAAELTFYGSEVVHPFTMEQAIRANIPIRIRNVVNTRSPGTIIYPNPSDIMSVESSSLFRSRSLSAAPRYQSQQPTAVTVKPQITVLNVHSKKRTRAHGFLASIFSILDQNGLSVDLISSSEVQISMAIHSEHALLALYGEDDLRIQSASLQRAISSLKAWGDVDLVPNLAIISLVGRQLRSMLGMSGRFFSTLGEHGINIEMISQGASEISIGCVIEEREADRALNVVHDHLFGLLD